MLYYGFRNQHGMTHVVTPENVPLGGWRIDASTNLYDWGGVYHEGTLRLATAILRHRLKLQPRDGMPYDAEKFARDFLVRQPLSGFDLDPAEIDAWLAIKGNKPKHKPVAKLARSPFPKRKPKAPKLAGRT